MQANCDQREKQDKLGMRDNKTESVKELFFFYFFFLKWKLFSDHNMLKIFFFWWEF